MNINNKNDDYLCDCYNLKKHNPNCINYVDDKEVDKQKMSKFFESEIRENFGGVYGKTFTISWFKIVYRRHTNFSNPENSEKF